MAELNLGRVVGEQGPPGKDGTDATVTKDKIVQELGYTPVDVKELTNHTSNTSNPHNVTKAQVGLGDVDNTSDMDKPVSTAVKKELDEKLAYEDTILYSERVKIIDTRDIEDTPLDIMRSGSASLMFDFKRRTRVGRPGYDISANKEYAHILTIFGWRDNTGGYPTQISFGKEKVGIRTGISNEEWSEWRVHSPDSDIFKEVKKLIDIKIDEIPEVFHDLPQNEVKEEMTPAEFDYGVTLCSQSLITDFPSINEYGVSYTIIGRHSNYVQLFITRFGDIWSRRSTARDGWNGEWYNSKRQIDFLARELNVKANKTDIPTKVSQLENDSGYLKQKDIESLGGGDMSKDVYDTNKNGIIDISESIVIEDNGKKFQAKYKMVNGRLNLEVVKEL